MLDTVEKYGTIMRGLEQKSMNKRSQEVKRFRRSGKVNLVLKVIASFIFIRCMGIP